MIEVDFLLCLTNGLEMDIKVILERCPSCYAKSFIKILCRLKCYERFKVHKNSNRYNSGPEVDFDIIPTALIIVWLYLKGAATNFRQVAPQVPLLKTPKISNPLFSRFSPMTPLEIFTSFRVHVLLTSCEVIEICWPEKNVTVQKCKFSVCLLYTSPSPRD